VADVVPTAPNPSTAQARVLVDELARSGVQHAVVCPGSRSAALAIALHEEPRIRTHVHIDERSAAFVALGIGRATGVPAVVVVTSGTAVANLLPAAVEADHAGVPLLLLTADRPPELRDTGANQTIDQVGLLGAGMRWTVDLGVAEDRADAVRTWRSVACRAVVAARGLDGGLPGPVHLNVPFREPTVPVSDDGRAMAAPFLTPLDGRGAFAPWVEVHPPVRTASPELTDTLARRFASVERGLIVVGAEVGVGSGVSAAATDALSRATGWPVIAERHTAARQGERTLHAGSWLLADTDFMSRRTPDLVMRFGRPTLHTSWGRVLHAGVPQILIDAHGGRHDPDRAVRELVVAEPDRLVADVVARLPVAASSDWSEAWSTADRGAAAVVDALLDEAATAEVSGLHVARAVTRAVAQQLPAPGTLVVGSSLAARDLDLVAGVSSGEGVIVHANRGAAGIDGTVSTALGVALGTGEPVTLLVGDLTLLHDTNGWLLSPDAPALDVTCVVVDNGGGRIFDLLPPASHAPAFARLFTTPSERDLSGVAALHGLRTVTLDAVGVGSTEAGPALCVVTVDMASDLATRERLRQGVAEVLAAR
jgi:2-succinyl-5-enolpyruvyl-6-hydroxy-3-cyclohexene-1-carboxylate synthase